MVPLFVRIQSPEPSESGVHLGVFALINLLSREGRLSEEDDEYRHRQNVWFEAAFPDPTTVDKEAYDATHHPHAVAWFKTEASGHLLDALQRHVEILDRHGVRCERVERADPGRVVYEDQWQVVAVPHDEFLVQGHEVVEALDA